MRRPHRNHSPLFKAKVALAALKGDETIAALASRFDDHPHQITQWNQQLVGDAASVFANDPSQRAEATAVDLKALHAKTGQQALEIDVLGRRAWALSQPERQTMIDRSDELSVTWRAAMLGLSRASVYYAPRAVPDADLAVMRRLDALHLELPFAGSRMLRGLLCAEASPSVVTTCAR